MLVDAHEDMAYSALHFGRDARRSAYETRRVEAERRAHEPPATVDLDLAGDAPATFKFLSPMLGLPEHRRGGVGLVFATLYSEPAGAETMAADALAQYAYYVELTADAATRTRFVRTRDELAALERDWQAAPAPDERPVGLTLLMEGADQLRDPAELDAWYARGLRIVGPAWHATRYAGGTSQPGPLTDLGRALLREMERLGMTLDVSHLAEQSFWQALDSFSGPVIASHANCRAYLPTDRHLSDAMIRALIERDAVIGVVLGNRFLVNGWTVRSGAPVMLDAVVRHVEHICELAGDTRHCGLGSDFDGGFGVENTPVELDSVADLPRIGDALAHAGYDDAAVAGILGDNWLRFLSRALP